MRNTITPSGPDLYQRFPKKISEDDLDQEIQEIACVSPVRQEFPHIYDRDSKNPIRLLTVSGMGAISSYITATLSDDHSLKVAGYVTSASFGAFFCGTCYQWLAKK